MRILFVTSNRVGDAVLSTGLLDHLLRNHPGAAITIACGPAAEGVFERMPNRTETIVFDKRPYGRHWFDLWARAVRTRWDLVVDIRGSALAFLLSTRARAVMRRVGSATNDEPKVVELARVLRVTPPPLPVAWTGAEDRARADELLCNATGPLIALGPTANWNGKIWPAERFVALFARLSAIVPGAVPVVLAGPGDAERALARPVLDALPGAIDLAGKLSLPEAAAVLSRAHLFVGNDSGLMHLAASTGTPTLGLFGPTPALAYAPAGPHAAAAVSPDGTMAGLSVDAAFEAATSLLQRAQSPGPADILARPTTALAAAPVLD